MEEVDKSGYPAKILAALPITVAIAFIFQSQKNQGKTTNRWTLGRWGVILGDTEVEDRFQAPYVEIVQGASRGEQGCFIVTLRGLLHLIGRSLAPKLFGPLVEKGNLLAAISLLSPQQGNIFAILPFDLKPTPRAELDSWTGQHPLRLHPAYERFLLTVKELGWDTAYVLESVIQALKSARLRQDSCFRTTPRSFLTSDAIRQRVNEKFAAIDPREGPLRASCMRQEIAKITTLLAISHAGPTNVNITLAPDHTEWQRVLALALQLEGFQFKTLGPWKRNGDSISVSPKGRKGGERRVGTRNRIGVNVF